MIYITSVDERLIHEDIMHIENKKLCKDLVCITLSSTVCCSIFMLWFLHEINVEFHNTTTVYMGQNR